MQTASHRPHFSFSSPTGKSYLKLRVSRRSACKTFCALCVIALVALGVTWGAAKLFSKPAGSVGTTFELRSGPWGKITARPILIEAPARLLSPGFRLGDGRWYFPARTRDAAGSFLRDAGLDTNQIATLLPQMRQIPGRGDLLAVSPPPGLVRSLPADVRSRLYDKLAAIPENFAQAEPFRTTDLHLDRWLDSGKLPPEVIDEVKSLIWRRGSGLFFSDYNLVADKISSPAVKLELLGELTRKSSVVLTLHVPPGDDVHKLVGYYGVNGREDNVGPLLEAVSHSGGDAIGLSNILPVFARGRLYRFPDAIAGTELGPDCHWTTFNFFNQGVPDDAFREIANIQKVLKEKYEPVAGAPRFGDIVLLMLPDGSAIHSATYIADNIVFTKNGPSLAAPFLLTTTDDMLAFYPSSERIALAYYRLKGA